MGPADSLIENAVAQARALGKSIQHDAKIRSLNACYRRALKDPETKIPTYLHAALEALREEV